MITLKDLMVPEDPTGIFSHELITGRVYARNAKDGKMLFDTYNNKQEHIEKFYDWQVEKLFPDFRIRKGGAFIENEELIPVIGLYLSDYYKEGGLPY